jgi:hypothetical protein
MINKVDFSVYRLGKAYIGSPHIGVKIFGSDRLRFEDAVRYGGRIPNEFVSKVSSARKGDDASKTWLGKVGTLNFIYEITHPGTWDKVNGRTLEIRKEALRGSNLYEILNDMGENGTAILEKNPHLNSDMEDSAILKGSSEDISKILEQLHFRGLTEVRLPSDKEVFDLIRAGKDGLFRKDDLGIWVEENRATYSQETETANFGRIKWTKENIIWSPCLSIERNFSEGAYIFLMRTYKK